MEKMKRVSHQQARQLLHNKFVVILGDSVQRSVYKDLVLLLQNDRYLSKRQLKDKGEMSFEQDRLVEGGRLGEMHNGTAYREVRQFQSDHHLVRFYFVTRVYSAYMQSILEDFRKGLKPDLIIFNSCIWDISRYNSKWLDTYRENLQKFFKELKGIVPEETLVIWNLAMPLGERITGGFLVPEITHKAPQLRYDVVDANFYSGTLADAYGMDVLDLHFQFRLSLQHRMKDGVHWNAVAHRRITSLLLQHSAQAWGVDMPLTAVEHTENSGKENVSRPAGGHRRQRASNYQHIPPRRYLSNMEQRPSMRNYNGYWQEFLNDGPVYGNFNNQQPHHLPPPPPHLRHGSHCRPYYDQHCYRTVERIQHTRHHYTPYTPHRPNQYDRHGHFY